MLWKTAPVLQIQPAWIHDLPTTLPSYDRSMITELSYLAERGAMANTSQPGHRSNLTEGGRLRLQVESPMVTALDKNTLLYPTHPASPQVTSGVPTPTSGSNLSNSDLIGPAQRYRARNKHPQRVLDPWAPQTRSAVNEPTDTPRCTAAKDKFCTAIPLWSRTKGLSFVNCHRFAPVSVLFHRLLGAQLRTDQKTAETWTSEAGRRRIMRPTGYIVGRWPRNNCLNNVLYTRMA